MSEPTEVSPSPPSVAPDLRLLSTHALCRKFGCGRRRAEQIVAKLDDATLQKIVDADNQPSGDDVIRGLMKGPEQKAEEQDG